MRLTKTYEDGTFGVADELPCGENSHAFKKLVIDKLGSYEELELARSAPEPTASPNEVKADKGILTEEELKERNRLLVLENDELLTDNIKVKQALKKVKDHLEGVMNPRRFVILDGPGMLQTLSQALEELQ